MELVLEVQFHGKNSVQAKHVIWFRQILADKRPEQKEEG